MPQERKQEVLESLFGVFYFEAEGLILLTETGLKDYCATSRPSVHNCIRHDNVLFFTAINTMAPVGLLLFIVCLELPGKQALQETALFLR